MTLNDKDKEYIKYLIDEINKAKKFNDKDYWKATIGRIDNIPRETTIKMLCDLAEYFELNQKPEED